MSMQGNVSGPLSYSDTPSSYPHEHSSCDLWLGVLDSKQPSPAPTDPISTYNKHRKFPLSFLDVSKQSHLDTAPTDIEVGDRLALRLMDDLRGSRKGSE
ncbi:hypothetical protein GcM1_205049 [Golovinomyces cichoracearum]|uniref:Uncharacterized protein n=1 Tax=Golovinomyces cichoracearum TaxID=62708 RepID=A0A420IXA2_9PEZI|nr:hypothetical protein GcM1_205049 [Golovinomyces cichoracearum]